MKMRDIIIICVVGECALQLDEVVVGAVCGEKRARVLEVLELGVTLQRTHRGLVVPVGEKHPAIGRGEPVLLPLGQVVISSSNHSSISWPR